MKYLDEKIIATVNFATPITADGTYKYKVRFVDDIKFIGNCFIAKGATSKTIDITDIVRNNYNFSYPYESVYFDEEDWAVRIYDSESKVLGSSIIWDICPIYRYPNRKASLETPLSTAEVDWIQPALQGFDSEHKGTFLPHIPFVFSDKVEYNLALNCGNTDDIAPKLSIGGVVLNTNIINAGIYNTKYSLKNLFTFERAEVYEFTDVVDNVGWERTHSGIGLTSFAPLTYEGYLLGVTPFRYYYYENGQPKRISIDNFPYNNTIGVKNTDFRITAQNTDFFVRTYPTSTADENFVSISIASPESTNYVGALDNPVNFTKSGNDWVYKEVTAEALKANFYIQFKNSSGEQLDEPYPITATASTYSLYIPDGYATIEIHNEEDASDAALATLSVSDFGLECSRIDLTCLLTLGIMPASVGVSITPKIDKYPITIKYSAYSNITAPVDTENIVINGITPESSFVTDLVNAYDALEGDLLEDAIGDLTLYDDNELWQLWSTDLFSQDLPTSLSGYIKYKPGHIRYFSIDSTDIGLQMLDFVCSNQIEGIYFMGYFSNPDLYFMTKFIPKDNSYYGGVNISVVPGGFEVRTVSKISNYKSIEVAKVDACPSRYYLQWRDRYGSMQMQPFSKAETYSEDFTRTEIKNYQDTRRLSNISIQPKWKLNSAWIPFDLVPYYESLMVSPWVKLYDSKEDQLYDVILKDSEFTEKTYRNNDRQLWHLEVECEQTDKQNILY